MTKMKSIWVSRLWLSVVLGGALPFGVVSGCTHSKTLELNSSLQRDPAQAGRDPGKMGRWTPIVKLKDISPLYQSKPHRPRPADGWWVTPIQVNLMADGKVLVTGWSRSVEDYCGPHKGRQNGTSFILDPNRLNVDRPTTIEIDPIRENPRDPRDVLYCAGHAPLPDGRILFTGGARYDFLDVAGKEQEYGLNYARVFDPLKKEFLMVKQTSPAGPNPTPEERATTWKWYEQGMMWYPTNTRLPGGLQLVAGGFAQQNGPFEPEFPNKSFAIFDTVAMDKGKNPWTVLVRHEASRNAMNIGPFDYPHSYLLYEPVERNGKAYHVATWGGQNGQIALLSLSKNLAENDRMLEPPGGKRPESNGSADKTSLLLPSGEILVAGGGTDGKKEAQRIDIYNPRTDKWRSIPTGITRIRPASTLLPDGNVVILNGEGMWDGGGPTVGDRKQVTLFMPTKNEVFNLAAWPDDLSDRGYHNISLLLKDGSLLVGGGRNLWKRNGVEEYRIGCERPDLRIFKPPYLFRGPRPEILDLEEMSSIPLGGKKISFRFTGAKLRANGGVVLMAMGSETHHFDQNQRYVGLDFSVTGDVISAKSPRDSIVAPEGEYLLFLISDLGVPSVARTVRVGL